MSWWTTVPALTPIAAWDATAADSVLHDRVGTNDATMGTVGSNLLTYLAVCGNSNLWPLAVAITLPAECTVVGLVRVQSNSILFYGGNTPNAYLFDQESSGAGHYFYAGSGSNYGILGSGPQFGEWKFMAMVKRTSNFGLYINGVWSSETGGNLGWLPPSIGGFGYQSNGSAYNFNNADFMSAAGVWSGAATLAELQALEAAVRLELAGPTVNAFSAPLGIGYSVNNPLALLPGQHPKVSAPLKAGWKNIYQGGSGTIQGTVTIENIPGARQVRLFDKRTGLVIGETWSSATGHYEFTNLDTTREYFVVAHDHLRMYNAVVQDMLTP